MGPNVSATYARHMCAKLRKPRLYSCLPVDILIKPGRPRADRGDEGHREQRDGGSSNNNGSESREQVAATSAAMAAATAGPPLMYASDTDISGKEFALN